MNVVQKNILDELYDENICDQLYQAELEYDDSHDYYDYWGYNDDADEYIINQNISKLLNNELIKDVFHSPESLNFIVNGFNINFNFKVDNLNPKSKNKFVHLILQDHHFLQKIEGGSLIFTVAVSDTSISEIYYTEFSFQSDYISISIEDLFETNFPQFCLSLSDKVIYSYIEESWELLEEYSDSKQYVFEHFESYQSLIKMIEI